MYTSSVELGDGAPSSSDMDLALHELSRGYGINGVCQMVRIDNGEVFAD